MEGRVPESHAGRRAQLGGIIGLAKIVSEHREAIEYDLLTRTGYQLTDIGGALRWESLNAFLKQSGPGTALMQELHPEFAGWGTQEKANAILADIYDLLANINYNLIAIGGGKPKKPKPYPRPIKKEPENVRHIGRGALPTDELRKWFEEKRKKHAGSS